MMASAKNDPRRAGAIWVADLDAARPMPAPLLATVFRRVGAESAGLLTAATGGLPSELLSRFEAGRQCYTAWVEGKLAGYGWVSFDEEYVGELNVRVRLLPGEVYIWDCFTAPAYRNHGIYSALLAHILGELQREGLRRAWIGADLDNVASQRGIARAGFLAVADMVVERVLAMRLVWVEGRTGVPEQLVADARRAFLDNRDSVWLKAIEGSGDSMQGELEGHMPLPPGGSPDGPSLPSAGANTEVH